MTYLRGKVITLEINLKTFINDFPQIEVDLYFILRDTKFNKKWHECFKSGQEKWNKKPLTTR